MEWVDVTALRLCLWGKGKKKKKTKKNKTHFEAVLSTEGSIVTESEWAAKLLSQERIEGISLQL